MGFDSFSSPQGVLRGLLKSAGTILFPEGPDFADAKFIRYDTQDFADSQAKVMQVGGADYYPFYTDITSIDGGDEGGLAYELLLLHGEAVQECAIWFIQYGWQTVSGVGSCTNDSIAEVIDPFGYGATITSANATPGGTKTRQFTITNYASKSNREISAVGVRFAQKAQGL